VRVTLDASVTLKWFLRTPAEADLPQATALLHAIEADEIRLIQPPHDVAEVAAVLVRERAATALDDLADVARIFDPRHLCRFSRGLPSGGAAIAAA
jgi:predicted nucleic acid-binding protein